MNKYQTIPRITEAMQFTGENSWDIMQWAHAGLPDVANAVVRIGVEGFVSVRAGSELEHLPIGGWIVRDGSNGFSVWNDTKFKAHFKELIGFSDFSIALFALRSGFEICRACWSAKSMHQVILLVDGAPSVRTMTGSVYPWSPSGEELMAKDWMFQVKGA